MPFSLASSACNRGVTHAPSGFMRGSTAAASAAAPASPARFPPKPNARSEAFTTQCPEEDASRTTSASARQTPASARPKPASARPTTAGSVPSVPFLNRGSSGLGPRLTELCRDACPRGVPVGEFVFDDPGLHDVAAHADPNGEGDDTRPPSAKASRPASPQSLASVNAPPAPPFHEDDRDGAAEGAREGGAEGARRVDHRGEMASAMAAMPSAPPSLNSRLSTARPPPLAIQTRPFGATPEIFESGGDPKGRKGKPPSGGAAGAAGAAGAGVAGEAAPATAAPGAPPPPPPPAPPPPTPLTYVPSPSSISSSRGSYGTGATAAASASIPSAPAKLSLRSNTRNAALKYHASPPLLGARAPANARVPSGPTVAPPR